MTLPISPSAAPCLTSPAKRSAQQAPPKLSKPSLHFGDPTPVKTAQSTKAPASQPAQPPAEPGVFSKIRWTGAWNALKTDLTTPRWWLQHAAIAGAITLATCWLPGSQLVTIPLWFGVEAALSAYKGHKHYKDYQTTTQAPQPAENEKKDTSWTAQQKRSGAWNGLKQGVKEGITKNFKTKLLVSGAVCLATCWLPGSQLILIPAMFSTFAAWDGIQRAFQGYDNPGAFSPALKQAGKTEAK
ncbi:hypothetical protein [Vampirovibrio sp.]|uniref:hypothetical protein n=1 Tax=Vampirovibrio sp. TaxID=2717857 RepID=UPI003593B9FF